MLHLKHEDTRLLVTAGVLYLVVALVFALLLPVAGLYVAVGWALLTVLVVQLYLFRRRQIEDRTQFRQLQAVQSLTHLLPLRAPLPSLAGWAASPELAATLYGLVRHEKPRVIVELGSGVSTIVMGYALEQNGAGHLYSLDHDAAFGEETRQRLAEHGLADYAEVLDAPLTDQPLDGETWHWYDPDALTDLPPVDLLVIDGPPRETQPHVRYPALPRLVERLQPRATVVLDDADRPEETEIVRRWREQFPAFAHTRVESPKGTAVLRRSA